MAIFDSILFEGQQADEYKTRKEKEKKDKEKEYNDKYNPDYGTRRNYGYGHKTPEQKDHETYMKNRYSGRDTTLPKERENADRHHDSKKAADKEIKRREIGHQRAQGERNLPDGTPNPYRQITNNKYYGKSYDGQYEEYGGERNRDQIAAADSIDRNRRRHAKKSKNESAGIFECVEFI